MAASAVGLLLGAFPITVFSFGVFLPSFVRDFHATRAAVSLAFTLHNVVSGLAAVLVGHLADRIAIRKVAVPGLLLLGGMLISAELLDGRLRTLYAFYAFLGIVAPMTTTVPYAVVVSRWFDRRRGLALGLMMIGLGGGAILMPPVAERLIAAYGWRTAFALIGVLVLVVPVPVVALLVRDAPGDLGLLPDGDMRNRLQQQHAPVQGLPWRDTFKTGTYWLMCAAFVLLAASVHACIVHIPALLADRGATARAAALASSVTGIALLVGRIGSGYVLDRVFAPRVAMAVCAGTAVGVAFLWIGTPGPLLFAGAFLVGLGMGAEVDVIAFLVSRYFGLRALGVTFGLAFGAFVIAGGVGPLLMGIGFDLTGSYRTPLTGCFMAVLVATVLLARLGPYRFSPVVPEVADQPANQRALAAQERRS